MLTADTPIGGAADGSVLVDEPATGSAGAAASQVVPAPAVKAELAVVYRDEAGNWSRPARISREGVPLGPTPVPPSGSGSGGPAGGPPPASGAAGAGDTAAPSLRVRAPRYGPSTGRVRVRWRGTDASALRYRVQVRRGAGRFRTLRSRTTATTLRHRAPRGSTLTFRVTATDAAGNRTTRSARTLIPLDQTSRRVRLDDGWSRAFRRRGAYGGSVAVARRAGARAVLRFRGTGVAVFLARGSRVRRIAVEVDGRRRTLRGRRRSQAACVRASRAAPRAAPRRHRRAARRRAAGRRRDQPLSSSAVFTTVANSPCRLAPSRA